MQSSSGQRFQVGEFKREFFDLTLRSSENSFELEQQTQQITDKSMYTQFNDIRMLTPAQEINLKIEQAIAQIAESPSKETPLRSSDRLLPAVVQEYISQDTPFQPLEPGEVILSICFYHTQKNTKAQEFLVLASQPISVLIDEFYCLNNYTLDGPTCKSGFLFIEGVFYNDFRDPNAIDYSQSIIEWINTEDRASHENLGNYISADIRGVTFADLTVQIGEYYLFQHQGNCQHYFEITDIRVAQKSHNQNSLEYPLSPFQSKIRRKKCKICDIYPAKFVTYSDRLAPENPCFFCDHCYRPLHYSYEGKLLYSDFEVFPYFHE